ncbi:MAG TPA: hypothetical protein VHW44_06265, partial [Pseudonocardiaceae bacterium]|nr:hypothetical protein [Pseudonocardiaceae bacterium]
MITPPRPTGPGGPRRLPKSRSRRRILAAAVAAFGLLIAFSLTAISNATAAPQAPRAETALPETGWSATASTNSAAADTPANAIDGNLNTRYSSD